MVKLRLQRKGRKAAPFYHIVVADARAPRDGRFIEKVGTYNPMTKPATIVLDTVKAYDWLTKGAQPTDTVAAILRFKGVMYQKHLMRGVAKGALTTEQAEIKLKDWVEAKDKKVEGRVAEVKKEKSDKLVQISGVAKPKPVPVVEVVAAPTVEAVVAPAPVVEAVAAPIVEEVVVIAPPVEEVVAAAEAEVAPTPAAEEIVADAAPAEETLAAPAAENSEETPA